MSKYIFALMLLVPFGLSVASTKPTPKPDSKPPECMPGWCPAPTCPPNDPNGCGILD